MRKYKQTGTKWITSIPVSWDMQKIGALFVQRKEKVSDKDFAPISVTKNGIFATVGQRQQKQMMAITARKFALAIL